MSYQINKVHICKKMGIPILNCKGFTNYPYKSSGIELNSGEKSIYRYAKDFTIDGITFCMMLLTEKKSNKKVEEFFESSLKEMSTDKFKKILLQVKYKPIELKIKYGDN